MSIKRREKQGDCFSQSSERERGYKRRDLTGLVASEGSGAAFGCLSFMSLNFFLSFNLYHCLKVSWCFLYIDFGTMVLCKDVFIL